MISNNKRMDVLMGGAGNGLKRFGNERERHLQENPDAVTRLIVTLRACLFEVRCMLACKTRYSKF